jgi:acetolactate decarboxylase
VPRDIIDDRLIGALHVRALSRSGLAHDVAHEHTVVQAGTLDALMGGRYDGDATIGELLRHGDLGIGTIQALDGELVVVDGEPYAIGGDATVRRVPLSVTTPFAVLCRFEPTVHERLDGPRSLEDLHRRLDALIPPDAPVAAVRVDGTFRDLRLRSVARQVPPYPPLAQVTAHQREWTVPEAEGSLVGFRFPDAAAGLEVPGFHLHFLAADRDSGGHVLGLTLEEGWLRIDGGDELHVELPPGVELGRPGLADRAAIASVEGARRPG